METPKRRSTLEAISGNVFWTVLRYASSWIALLFLPPFLIHHMAAASYSTWMLLLQFGSYVSFFDSSMQTAVSRYVGRADGTGDRDYLKTILSSVLLLLIGAACVALALSAVAAQQIVHLFPDIPASLQFEARYSLAIIGASLSIALPFTTLIGGFLGLQRNRVVTIGIISAKVISATGIAWAAAHHGSLIRLALFFSLGVLVPPMMYVAQWLSCRHDLPIDARLASLPFMREFGAFYAVLAANTLAAIIITGLDLPIVARFDFATVGIYSVATVFGNMLLITQGAIVSVVMPAAAGLAANRDPVDVGQSLYKFARYAAASMCALSAGLTLGAPLFLHLWLGATVARRVLPFALTLLAAQCVQITAEPYQVMVLATGRQAKLIPAWVTSAMVNLAFSLFLVQKMGAMGVALGTLIGSAASLCAQLLFSMPRTDTIRLPRRVYLHASVLEPLLACIPAAVLVLVLWSQHWNITLSAVFVAIGVPCTMAILLARTFSATERHELLRLLRIRRVA